MFHRRCRSDCDVEPFFKIIVCCFRTVNSDLTFTRFARLRDSNFKMRDSENRFYFLRAQDSETPVWEAVCPDPLFFKDHSTPLIFCVLHWPFILHWLWDPEFNLRRPSIGTPGSSWLVTCTGLLFIQVGRLWNCSHENSWNVGVNKLKRERTFVWEVERSILCTM